MKYDGVLFDMDGILIDSEPFWRQAEVEVFATVGVELTLDECAETMGLRIDEVVALRAPEADRTKTALAIVDRVEELVRAQGKPLLGAQESLEKIAELGLPCGLATSSSIRLLEATLETLGFRSFFEIVHSAEVETYGKPHPSVYIHAAEKLGVEPSRCFAIEDSVNGVIAAKAAKMMTIAIPEHEYRADKRFNVADLQLGSLLELLPLLDDWADL